MIKIRIGQTEKQFEEIKDIDEKWISQQINFRRSDGILVCVRVFINRGDVDIMLSTPSCEPSSGVSRPPSERENYIFDLWESHGLKDKKF